MMRWMRMGLCQHLAARIPPSEAAHDDDSELGDAPGSGPMVEAAVEDVPPPLPDVDMRTKRAKCIDIYKDVHESGAVCSELGFEMLPNWTLRRASDEMVVWRARLTFQDRCTYAKCERHNKCSMFVQVGDNFCQSEAWQVKWLIAGSECDHDAHLASSKVLKALVAEARPRKKKGVGKGA